MSQIAPRDEVERFEAFKSILRTFPAESVNDILAGQMSLRSAELLADCHEREVPKGVVRLTEKHLAVVAMAGQPDPERRRGFNAPASWLNYAQTALADYVAEDPAARFALMDTVFFHGDRKKLRALDVVVSASITPAGDYDHLAFRAGIASGMVNAEFNLYGRSASPQAPSAGDK